MMGDFEKDLRNAFEEAEFAPSEKVWEGVKSGIAPKKKKGVFYMWQTYGVAATLLFLLTMGSLFRDQLINNPGEDPKTEQLTQNKEATEKETTDQQSTESAKSNSSITDQNKTESPDKVPALTNPDLQASKTNETSSHSAEGANPAPLATDNTQVSALVADTPTIQHNPGEQIATDIPLLINTDIEELGIFDLAESMAAIRGRWEHNNLVGPMEIEFSKEKEGSIAGTRKNSLNGSFGAGTFNPNSDLLRSSPNVQELRFSDPSLSADQTVANGEESQLGSLAAGFGVGIELGPKWVFKTGLRYSQYKFATTSNAYSVEGDEQLPIYNRVNFLSAEVRFAGEYEIVNTMHSISIPAQFGFRVVSLSKFSTWVNLGVAADYFLSHTVKGDLNFLETRKVDFGSSNFLNRFNMNVLSGLELTYQLNEKFALSGEMFFRQYVPLSGSESGQGSSASPSFFGFGLGLNYYLKKKN